MHSGFRGDLAANYLAFVQLASIRLWLRLYESAALGGHRQTNRHRHYGTVLRLGLADLDIS